MWKRRRYNLRHHRHHLPHNLHHQGVPSHWTCLCGNTKRRHHNLRHRCSHRYPHRHRHDHEGSFLKKKVLSSNDNAMSFGQMRRKMTEAENKTSLKGIKEASRPKSPKSPFCLFLQQKWKRVSLKRICAKIVTRWNITKTWKDFLRAFRQSVHKKTFKDLQK